MNLVWFLTVATLFVSLLGEFGKFPFGQAGAISFNDLLLATTLIFLFIWQMAVVKEITYPKLLPYLMLFWGVGFLSLVLAKNFGGFFYLLRFIFYSSSLWLGYALIKSQRVKISLLLNLLVGIGLLFLILGFIQLIVLPDFEALRSFGFDPHQGRLASTFLDPNFAGAFLNIFLLLCIYLWFIKRNRLFFIPIVAFLIGVLLTFSRSSYLMLVISVAILSVYLSKKILLVLVLFLILTFFAIPRFGERIVGALTLDQSAQERIASWQRGWSVFEKNPILGVGFNNLRYAYLFYNLLPTQTAEGGHSGEGVDSSMIFLLATTGVLGLTFFSFFYLISLKKLLGNHQTRGDLTIQATLSAILLGLLIHSQFVNSLFYPPIVEVCYLLLGAVLASDQKR